MTNVKPSTKLYEDFGVRAQNALANSHSREILPYSAYQKLRSDAYAWLDVSRIELRKPDVQSTFFSNTLKGEAYGQASGDIFQRWGNSPAPALPTILLAAARHFKITDTTDLHALTTAGICGMYQAEDNAYHNMAHHRKVVMQVIRLASAASPALSPHEITKLLVAAAVHDMGHDGKGNTRDGVHIQGFLEKRAVEISWPYLEAAGLSVESLKHIERMILSTDVSPLGSPDSPAARAIKTNDRLSVMLHAADLATSLVSSIDQVWKENLAVAREFGQTNPDPLKVAHNYRAFSAMGAHVLRALPEARIYEDHHATICAAVEHRARLLAAATPSAP